MAMNRRRKICIALAVFLVIFFFVLPLVLGVALRGTVEKKIGEVTKAPVKLGSLSVKLFPPGAVLGDLEIGETVKEAGGAPLAKIGTLKASVSWGTVFGGAKHVTALGIYDADVALACDENGESSLQRFLDHMGPSDRKEPLPIDQLLVANSRITMHAPPKILAPKSAVEPEPMKIQVGYLLVEGLVLPPPGQPAAAEQWTWIRAEDIRIAAPLKGVASPASLAGAGVALEEGVVLDDARLSIAMPTSAGVLKVRDADIRGLKVRNVAHAPNTPETLERIRGFAVLCMQGSDELKSRRERAVERRLTPTDERKAYYIDGCQIRDSAFEICGPDAGGQLAFYRLGQLEVEIRKFPWGPGAETPGSEQGLLRVASPSRSSSGDGSLLVEWTGIRGQWPKLTFDVKEEVKGFALSPLSARVEESAGAGVKGTLDLSMSGGTKDGVNAWDGAVTLSPDTELVGKSLKGKMISGIATISRETKQLATGKPIEGFGLRGTLDRPVPKYPPLVSDALAQTAQDIFVNKSVSLPGVLQKGAGGVIERGVQEGKDVLKKVPGLGDLLKK